MKTERTLTLGVALISAAQMGTLTGCGKEEPPPPPPPPRKAAPPPPPERIELATYMRGVDARIQFPDGKAPYDPAVAQTVISFAGAIVSGDDAALGGMLDLSSRGILDSMLADGTWFEATDEIEAVRVVYLNQDPDGADDASYAEFVLAIQEPGGAFTLGWSAEETDGGWVMSPLETVDLTLPRAADWDSDSLGAYDSELGWEPSTGQSAAPASAPGAGVDMNEALFAYLAAETLMRLSGQGSMDDMDEAELEQMQSMAGAQAGGAEGLEMILQGQASIRNGEKPDSVATKALVSSIVTTAGMTGGTWGVDDVIATMAEILGISETEMRDLYEG